VVVILSIFFNGIIVVTRKYQCSWNKLQWIKKHLKVINRADCETEPFQGNGFVIMAASEDGKSTGRKYGGKDNFPKDIVFKDLQGFIPTGFAYPPR